MTTLKELDKNIQRTIGQLNDVKVSSYESKNHQERLINILNKIAHLNKLEMVGGIQDLNVGYTDSAKRGQFILENAKKELASIRIKHEELIKRFNETFKRIEEAFNTEKTNHLGKIKILYQEYEEINAGMNTSTKNYSNIYKLNIKDLEELRTQYGASLKNSKLHHLLLQDKVKHDVIKMDAELASLNAQRIMLKGQIKKLLNDCSMYRGDYAKLLAQRESDLAIVFEQENEKQRIESEVQQRNRLASSLQALCQTYLAMKKFKRQRRKKKK